jgi:hypothetical protein
MKKKDWDETEEADRIARKLTPKQFQREREEMARLMKLSEEEFLRSPADRRLWMGAEGFVD